MLIYAAKNEWLKGLAQAVSFILPSTPMVCRPQMACFCSIDRHASATAPFACACAIVTCVMPRLFEFYSVPILFFGDGRRIAQRRR